MYTLFGAPIMDEQQLSNDQYQFEAKMLNLLDSKTNWRRREQGQNVRNKYLCLSYLLFGRVELELLGE